MASIKFKNALGVESGWRDGFGGIDRRAKRPSDASAYLSNLDIDPDGSISTRSGYRKIMSLSAPIRAVCSDGKGFYCLAGDELSRTDTESGETVIVAKTENAVGEGEIFFFGGELMVHDSKKLYRFADGVLIEIDGYAPLYGKEWHPKNRGAVFEDRNTVSDRIRISYLTAGSFTEFDTGLDILSLDRVEINGEAVDIESYGIVLKENKIDFTHNVGLADGMLITFWFTLKDTESKRPRLEGGMRSFVFSNSGGERLCLYPPEGDRILYCSRIPSPREIAESKKSAPASTSLYLPDGAALRIGNSSSPITGMAHHKDRALLFTDADTWCVDFEGRESDPDYLAPKLFLLNSAIGSEAGASSANCENDPISYYRGKFFRWHSASGVRDECSAELISEAVADLLPKDGDAISMLSVPHENLLLISSGEDLDGSLILYNTDIKNFTLYQGIFAEKLFLFDSSPAFSRGETVYLLCGDCDRDIDIDEEYPIPSRIVSHFLDFGSPEKVKHTLSLLACGSFEGDVTVGFENERGEKVKYTLGKTAGMIGEKFSLPPFRKLRWSIESRERLRLESILLSVQ